MAARIQIALATTLALCVGACGQPVKQSDGCDVAFYAFKTLALDKRDGSPWSLDTLSPGLRFVTPDKADPDRPPSEMLPIPETFQPVSGSGALRPQSSTIQAMSREAARSIESCEAVRTAALTAHALPPAPDAARMRGPNELYRVESVTMSKPTLSGDGSEALVYVAYIAGPLAASGQLYLLRRDTRGDWSVAGFAGLWIS